MLSPRPRTWRAKLIEMARAVQLEAHFSKRDILGMWLTLAPVRRQSRRRAGRRAGVVRHLAAPAGPGPGGAAGGHPAPPRGAAPRPLSRPRPRTARPHPARRRRARKTCRAGRLPMPAHARVQMAALPRAPRVGTTLDLPLQIALERLAAERIDEPARARLARHRHRRRAEPGDPRHRFWRRRLGRGQGRVPRPYPGGALARLGDEAVHLRDGLRRRRRRPGHAAG